MTHHRTGSGKRVFTADEMGGPVVRTYRRRATFEAVQWFKMGDHPGVIRRERWPEPRDECWVYWIGRADAGFPVEPGDWLVSDRPGFWSPMKPDKFAATYELATPEQPA